MYGLKICWSSLYNKSFSCESIFKSKLKSKFKIKNLILLEKLTLKQWFSTCVYNWSKPIRLLNQYSWINLALKKNLILFVITSLNLVKYSKYFPSLLCWTMIWSIILIKLLFDSSKHLVSKLITIEWASLNICLHHCVLKI